MSTLIATYAGTDTWSYGISGTLLAQTFVVPAGYDRVDYVNLPLIRTGTVTGDVTVSLYATSGGYPTGSSLGSATLAASSIATSGTNWYTFNWADIAVTPGARYAIVMHNNGTSSSSYVGWKRGSTAGYGGGAGFYKYSGGAWTDWSKDFGFVAYGSVSVVLPTVSTTAAASITATGATLAGNVSSAGGGTVSSRGYVISDTDTTPDKNEERTIVDGSGTGAFGEAIGGLSPNRLYYYRSFATNEAGTAYGAVQTFTTPSTTPTVASGSVSSISSTSASCSGTVSSDGGSTVTTRGICYNTTGTPTTADSIVASGSGTGSFTSNLSGLTEDTTYYWRAYATNGEGTSYGTQYSFSTKDVITQWAQSFTTVSAGVLTKVSLYLREVYASSSTATLKIYSDSTGEPGTLLATYTKTINSGGYQWYEFTAGASLDATTDYWLVLETPYVVGTRHIYWGANSGGSYGGLLYSTDGGSTWSAGTGCAAFDLDVQPSLTVEYDVEANYKKRFL